MPTSAQPAPAKPKRRWWQYGLGTMFVVVFVIAVFLAAIVVPAERQRRAVALVEGLGGDVICDFPDLPQGFEPAPTWLETLVGVDYFRSVNCVFLSESEVVDKELVVLQGLTDLEFLYLPKTRISDVGLVHLKGLKKLELLDLSGTQVTDEGLVHLNGMTALKTLELKNTPVSDAGLAHLECLFALQELGLENTQISKAGVAKFLESHPTCHVYSGLYQTPTNRRR